MTSKVPATRTVTEKSKAQMVPSTQENVTEEIAVSAKNLYKVFGRRPKEAVERLQHGASRDEITELGTAAVID